MKKNKKNKKNKKHKEYKKYKTEYDRANIKPRSPRIILQFEDNYWVKLIRIKSKENGYGLDYGAYISNILKQIYENEAKASGEVYTTTKG